VVASHKARFSGLSLSRTWYLPHVAPLVLPHAHAQHAAFSSHLPVQCTHSMLPPPLLAGPWPPHDTARPGWSELASLAPYATSIAALERCQGSPAWMDRAARPPVNAAASSSTAAFAALPPLCEAYAASAG